MFRMRYPGIIPAVSMFITLMVFGPVFADTSDLPVWDLSPLYKNIAAWEAERDLVLKQIPEISRLKGTLSQSAQNLADGLDEIADLRARAGKLSIYGFLASDTDNTSEIARKQYEVGTGLESEVEASVAFLAEEIRAIGPERVKKWMQQEPRLLRHRERLNRIFAETPYSLPAQAQSILESAARWPRLAADTFWALHESDLGWPAIRNSSDTEIQINRSSYFTFRNEVDSEERSRGMASFLKSLTRLEDVFGLLYARRIEADRILAEHRGFRSGMDAQWFLREGLPPGSFRVMIDVTRAHLDTFHRYARLRSRAAGSNSHGYDSLFVRPPSATPAIPLEKAREIALSASQPLGSEYLALLRDGMNQPWMHLAPAKNKNRTYAIWPPVGGIPPYVIMTYDGSYDSARRFAGAMTLMVSFSEWRNSNAPSTRDDPGIYSNGMIYVGDLLFDEFMLSQARTREERIAGLVNSLDFLRHQYLQWALYSELDMKVEDLVRQGETPDGRRISEMYLELLKEYLGGGDGITVDEMFGEEWMLQSVPFLSYEHQFWPPAVAAACSIVQQTQRGNPAAARAVYQVLGSSPSDRTHGLLLQAGIDLTKPEPYLAVFERMDRSLDELETLLSGKY